MASADRMRLFGLAAWSGSGKTTLLARLLPELIGRGLSVSTVKHAHHEFDLDQPGKDSFRHREAGATEVMITSARRWAVQHELRGEAEPALEDLVARMSPVDLLLVEGFKRHAHPKLEVLRASLGKEPLYPSDPLIRAIYAVERLPAPLCATIRLPIYDESDIAGLADLIIAEAAPIEGPNA
ncbi:MAG: molybdopterin-guanine dinucleotide biosynthesis adapter protein [Aliidongia sp.]|jgi:molybdopterin-guanine dinucleotide biosynthesis protein B|nr:molybdopterin-guanine dinucleotide biosynthesis adapter protein [Aliidongia sp.]